MNEDPAARREETMRLVNQGILGADERIVLRVAAPRRAVSIPIFFLLLVLGITACLGWAYMRSEAGLIPVHRPQSFLFLLGMVLLLPLIHALVTSAKSVLITWIALTDKDRIIGLVAQGFWARKFVPVAISVRDLSHMEFKKMSGYAASRSDSILVDLFVDIVLCLLLDILQGGTAGTLKMLTTDGHKVSHHGVLKEFFEQVQAIRVKMGTLPANWEDIEQEKARKSLLKWALIVLPVIAAAVTAGILLNTVGKEKPAPVKTKEQSPPSTTVSLQPSNEPANRATTQPDKPPKAVPPVSQPKAEPAAPVSEAAKLTAQAGTAAQPEEKIAFLTKALEADPKYKPAYLLRGNLYFNKKDFRSALDDFGKASELAPGDASIVNRVANALLSLKEYDKAAEAFGRAIQLDPKYPNAHYGLGLLRMERKDYDGAIASFDEAVRLNAKYASAYNGRGQSRFFKNEYDAAIQDFSRAVELEPKFTVAYRFRGVAYYRTGEFEKALQDQTKAIELAPDHVTTYKNRGDTYKKLNQPEFAEKDYARAKELERGKVNDTGR